MDATSLPFMNIKHKLILLGDSHVGKTSFVKRLAQSTFSQNVNPTVGAAFTQFRQVINNKEHIFMIWDTAGEERFRSMMPLYAQGAAGALIFFDLSSKESFNHLPEWLSFARSDIQIPVLVVGNKCDLQKEVNETDILNFYSSQHLSYCECSAKSGFGVEEAFMEIAMMILDFETNKKVQKIDLNTTDEGEPGNGSCC